MPKTTKAKTSAKSEPYPIVDPDIPKDDDEETKDESLEEGAEIKGKELKKFTDLGYSAPLYVFTSFKSGRDYVGPSKGDFGCWRDEPVKFGYIKMKNGRLLNKKHLKEKDDDEYNGKTGGLSFRVAKLEADVRKLQKAKK